MTSYFLIRIAFSKVPFCSSVSLLLLDNFLVDTTEEFDCFPLEPIPSCLVVVRVLVDLEMLVDLSMVTLVVVVILVRVLLPT